MKNENRAIPFASVWRFSIVKNDMDVIFYAINENMPLPSIAKYTGLSIEELQNITTQV